jgi:two-component system, NtrC family, nitrogen regulation response regulator NtrX
MSPKKKILVVDDDQIMGDILADILNYKGYNVQWIGSGAEALQILSENHIDIVMLDLLLPGLNGIEILKEINKIKPGTTVIMMSGHGTIRTAVEATQLGAYDWLEKPLEKDRVLLTVKNAIEKNTLLNEREILLVEAKERYKMIGTSPGLKKVYQLIDKVAPTNATILVTGESGTGKELVAHAIHINSKRAASPFIQLNCAAVPYTLIESELFGHVKGSFTGAHTDRKGRFQLANSGTLFLDEIGDLSQPAQAKLLRAIETNEVETVGAEKTNFVDVRYIFATNKNLKEMVKNEKFREDLLHRIDVIEIAIPPLRERPEDVIPLAHFFFNMFCSQNNIKQKQLTPDADAILLSHKWNGNVRELRNLVEKIVILFDDPQISGSQISRILNSPTLDLNLSNTKTYKQAKESFEKSFVLHALSSNNWNVVKTAKALDMERSVLYKKMDKYGIRKLQKEDR